MQRNITLSGLDYGREYVFTVYTITGAGESATGTSPEPFTLPNP